MRVFVSYAREQLKVAEQITYGLRNEGHHVFFAEDDLRASDNYPKKIRDEIHGCNLFLFLISPESVSARYPLTELETFKKCRPVPDGHALPVMAVPVSMDQVPNYLRPLTILNPQGDLVAELLNRVAEIASTQKRKRIIFAAAIFMGIILVGVSTWFLMHHWNAKPIDVTVKYSLSIFKDPDQSSEIIAQLRPGEEFTAIPRKEDPNWFAVNTGRQNGWAMEQDIGNQDTSGGGRISLGQGYGYKGGYWSLFFTSPQKEGRPPNQFGIDMRFADAIGRVQKSLDIAVFEFNNKTITDAVLEAHQRGVAVRIVTGKLGYEEKNETFTQLEAGGIHVVVRPDSSFMHNKFAILDGKSVWTGSWNYTDGATYKNNENALDLEGEDFAKRYQSIFNQMFDVNKFGNARKPAPAVPVLSHDVKIMFAPEDPIVEELLKDIRNAKHSIKFMAFAITLDELTQALIDQSQHLSVQAILEPKLARNPAAKSLCAPPSAIGVRFASSPHFLHHDVFVIDGKLVITGSTNFSHNAMHDNDENILFIPDETLAKKYDTEFSRLWGMASSPAAGSCAPAGQQTASDRDTN